MEVLILKSHLPMPPLLLVRVLFCVSRPLSRPLLSPNLCLTCLPAAAAARINAQLQARKGIQHVDVPPIKPAESSPAIPAPTSQSSSKTAPALNGEMYVADGDYIQDIEVNDLRNRYLLTKGSTQKMVNTL